MSIEIVPNLLILISLILYLVAGTITYRSTKVTLSKQPASKNIIQAFLYFLIAYIKACFLCGVLIFFSVLLATGLEGIGVAIISALISPFISMAIGLKGFVALGFPVALALYYIKPERQIIWNIIGAMVGSLSYVLYLHQLGKSHQVLYLPSIIGFATGYFFYKIVDKEVGIKPKFGSEEQEKPKPKDLIGLAFMTVGGFFIAFAIFIGLHGNPELLLHPAFLTFVALNVVLFFIGFKRRKVSRKSKPVNPFDNRD